VGGIILANNEKVQFLEQRERDGLGLELGLGVRVSGIKSPPRSKYAFSTRKNKEGRGKEEGGGEEDSDSDGDKPKIRPKKGFRKDERVKEPEPDPLPPVCVDQQCNVEEGFIVLVYLLHPSIQCRMSGIWLGLEIVLGFVLVLCLWERPGDLGLEL
jgi:hypothetical protein